MKFWSLVAQLTSVAGLVFAGYQFKVSDTARRESVTRERQMKSVDLFIKYNELKLAGSARQTMDAGEAESRRSMSIALTESIFMLEGDDSGWRATVKGMLVEEDGPQHQLSVDCATIDGKFGKFASESVGRNICTP
jgi:hypothetical protein